MVIFAQKKLYQWRHRFKTFKPVGILYNPGIFNRICFTSSRQQQTFEAFWLSPFFETAFSSFVFLSVMYQPYWWPAEVAHW